MIGIPPGAARWHPVAALMLAGLVGTSCTHAPAASAGYDVVITNGKIIDGTGNPYYYGDIGIKGDRIATIAVQPRRGDGS